MLFHTWLGYSACLSSCSSSVLQGVWNKSETVSTSFSVALGTDFWKRVQLSRGRVAGGAWDLAPRLLGVGEDGFLACNTCALMQGLCHQLKELQEVVSRLQHSSRDYKTKMDQIFSDMMRLQEIKPVTALKRVQAESVFIAFGK